MRKKEWFDNVEKQVRETETTSIEDEAKSVEQKMKNTLEDLAYARKALNEYSWLKENRDGEIGTVYDVILSMLHNADSLIEGARKNFYESTYRHLKQLHNKTAT